MVDKGHLADLLIQSHILDIGNCKGIHANLRIGWQRRRGEEEEKKRRRMGMKERLTSMSIDNTMIDAQLRMLATHEICTLCALTAYPVSILEYKAVESISPSRL